MAKKKICMAASSGGHYEELLMLMPLLERYDGFILTEKTAYHEAETGVRTYYVRQVNRREWDLLPKLSLNFIVSLAVYIKERPGFIICTGALAVIPMCLLVKLFGGKLVYIESFANIASPSRTGKFLYKYADRFYVQWESMKEFYPEAECLDGIY